jgi:hypothetical protein
MMAQSPSVLKLISEILAQELRDNLNNCANEEDAANVFLKTMFDAFSLSESQPSSIADQKRIRRKRKSKRKIWAQFNIGKWVNQSDMIGYDLYMRTMGMPVEFNLMNETVRRRANAIIPEPHR